MDRIEKDPPSIITTLLLLRYRSPAVTPRLIAEGIWNAGPSLCDKVNYYKLTQTYFNCPEGLLECLVENCDVEIVYWLAAEIGDIARYCESMITALLIGKWNRRKYPSPRLYEKRRAELFDYFMAKIREVPIRLANSWCWYAMWSECVHALYTLCSKARIRNAGVVHTVRGRSLIILKIMYACFLQRQKGIPVQDTLRP